MGAIKLISKADTSVTSLNNSNQQESFIKKKDEVDSIYEKNLTNVFLSEGTLKEDVIDEASAIDGGLKSPREGSGDGEFIASSVNHVDYNKLSTVLDNNNSSAGGKSIFYFQLILLCIMLIYRLLKTVYMLNVCLIIFMCIHITN